jgi:hypothetical protein
LPYRDRVADIGYAVNQLRTAVLTLAGSGSLQERLQTAWTGNVQMLWTDRYLPDHLNDRFRTLWERYTAPSDDPRSTILRTMDDRELVSLAFDSALASSS